MVITSRHVLSYVRKHRPAGHAHRCSSTQFHRYIPYHQTKYISSFGKRYLIKNVMHIGISLTNAIQFPAIQENAGCPKIGIDSHRSFPAFTFRITALRQIKHRLLTPVCLIPIESILAYFTIKSYQPFHVPRIYTSTLPLRNCKVKHIP